MIPPAQVHDYDDMRRLHGLTRAGLRWSEDGVLDKHGRFAAPGVGSLAGGPDVVREEGVLPTVVGPGHLSLVTGVRGHEDHAGVPLDDPEPGDVTGSEFLHIHPEISSL